MHLYNVDYLIVWHDGIAHIEQTDGTLTKIKDVEAVDLANYNMRQRDCRAYVEYIYGGDGTVWFRNGVLSDKQRD